MTCDILNMTRDMWHVTCDMWHMAWREVIILSKCQVPSSYGLGVKVSGKYLNKRITYLPTTLIYLLERRLENSPGYAGSVNYWVWLYPDKWVCLNYSKSWSVALWHVKQQTSSYLKSNLGKTHKSISGKADITMRHKPRIVNIQWSKQWSLSSK